MTDVAEQLRLALPKRPQAIDPEAVKRQPSMTKAIVLCADVAGFVNDKDLCRAIDIDPAVWARIKSGQANFPHDKYEQLFDEAGNEVPLLWLLHRRGYDLSSLRMRQTETEKQLQAEQSAREKAEAENKLLRDLLQGKAK